MTDDLEKTESLTKAVKNKIGTTDDYGGGFDDLEEFIINQLEFSIGHYNEDYVKRRVHSRIRRSDADSYSEYLRYLGTTPQEQKELLDAFSINVTGFFRNPGVWKEIRKILRKKTQENDGAIRVWSAGCADGREPYSIALLARADDRIDDDRITILATDINKAALVKAEKGVYEQSTTNDLHDQLSFLNNYEAYIDVEEDEGKFTVSDSVKELVDFRQHDIIRGKRRHGFDLVLCRNLFIYINSEHQEDVFTHVSDALEPGGYLVVGKSETVPKSIMDQFNAENMRMRIYKRI